MPMSRRPANYGSVYNIPIRLFNRSPIHDLLDTTTRGVL